MQKIMVCNQAKTWCRKVLKHSKARYRNKIVLTPSSKRVCMSVCVRVYSLCLAGSSGLRKDDLAFIMLQLC